jgi:hypothetical protein
MRKIYRFLFAIILVLTLLTSCRLSVDELTNEVEKSMRSSEDFKVNSIKIKSLILTKKAGNEYSGVLDTSEPNGDFTYSVEVIYDGTNMTWRIIE